jgi:hypothetical protein
MGDGSGNPAITGNRREGNPCKTANRWKLGCRNGSSYRSRSDVSGETLRSNLIAGSLTGELRDTEASTDPATSKTPML